MNNRSPHGIQQQQLLNQSNDQFIDTQSVAPDNGFTLAEFAQAHPYQYLKRLNNVYRSCNKNAGKDYSSASMIKLPWKKFKIGSIPKCFQQSYNCQRKQTFTSKNQAQNGGSQQQQRQKKFWKDHQELMNKYKRNLLKNKQQKDIALEERKRKLFSAKSIGPYKKQDNKEFKQNHQDLTKNQKQKQIKSTNSRFYSQSVYGYINKNVQTNNVHNKQNFIKNNNFLNVNVNSNNIILKKSQKQKQIQKSIQESQRQSTQKTQDQFQLQQQEKQRQKYKQKVISNNLQKRFSNCNIRNQDNMVIKKLIKKGSKLIYDQNQLQSQVLSKLKRISSSNGYRAKTAKQKASIVTKQDQHVEQCPKVFINRRAGISKTPVMSVQNQRSRIKQNQYLTFNKQQQLLSKYKQKIKQIDCSIGQKNLKKTAMILREMHDIANINIEDY